MENNVAYLLEWPETVVTKTLNPKITDVQKITRVQAMRIVGIAEKETDRISAVLRNRLLSVQSNRKARLLACRYYDALNYLLNREAENSRHASFKNEPLKEVHRSLSSSLETLLDFLEIRFGEFINLKAKASPKYTTQTKRFTDKIIMQLPETLVPPFCEKDLSELLVQVFSEFSSRIQTKQGVTYNEIKYIQKLATALEQLSEKDCLTDVYSITEELLIRLNFNYTKYIQYFIGKINDRLRIIKSLSEKLDLLLYYFKSFSQLYRERHVVYDSNSKSLNSIISRWFRREIRYVNRKMSLPIPAVQGDLKQMPAIAPKQYAKQKITCQLSADQMALILRSLDDLRIINARSLNDVFRTIVPYLSTPNKQELSYEAMRSKSYVAELKDQQRVTEVLEEMIRRIKNY